VETKIWQWNLYKSRTVDDDEDPVETYGFGNLKIV
jgi:hypothetical protein